MKSPRSMIVAKIFRAQQKQWKLQFAKTFSRKKIIKLWLVTTLYNVCAVPWGDAQYRGGCSVPWGDTMSTVGDILSTVGVFSTVGDIMINVGGYLEYRGGVQYRGGIS